MRLDGILRIDGVHRVDDLHLHRIRIVQRIFIEVFGQGHLLLLGEETLADIDNTVVICFKGIPFYIIKHLCSSFSCLFDGRHVHVHGGDDGRPPFFSLSSFLPPSSRPRCRRPQLQPFPCPGRIWDPEDRTRSSRSHSLSVFPYTLLCSLITQFFPVFVDSHAPGSGCPCLSISFSAMIPSGIMAAALSRSARAWVVATPLIPHSIGARKRTGKKQ